MCSSSDNINKYRHKQQSGTFVFCGTVFVWAMSAPEEFCLSSAIQMFALLLLLLLLLPGKTSELSASVFKHNIATQRQERKSYMTVSLNVFHIQYRIWHRHIQTLHSILSCNWQNFTVATTLHQNTATTLHLSCTREVQYTELASCLIYARALLKYVIFILWVRSVIKMLLSVKFVEDKVLTFLILHEKCYNSATLSLIWVKS